MSARSPSLYKQHKFCLEAGHEDRASRSPAPESQQRNAVGNPAIVFAPLSETEAVHDLRRFLYLWVEPCDVVSLFGQIQQLRNTMAHDTITSLDFL